MDGTGAVPPVKTGVNGTMTTTSEHTKEEAQNALRQVRRRVLASGRLAAAAAALLPSLALRPNAPLGLVVLTAAISITALLTWLFGEHVCMRGAERLEPLTADGPCLRVTFGAAVATLALAALQLVVCVTQPAFLS